MNKTSRRASGTAAVRQPHAPARPAVSAQSSAGVEPSAVQPHQDLSQSASEGQQAPAAPGQHHQQQHARSLNTVRHQGPGPADAAAQSTAQSSGAAVVPTSQLAAQPQPQQQAQAAPEQPKDHAVQSAAAADVPSPRPAASFVADETEAALRTLILGAVQSIQELKGVTSSELCDYIQLTHEDAVAAQPTEPSPNRDGNARPAGMEAVEAWVRVGGRRGRTSAARPTAVKALLQRSSMHELLAVLQASHQFVEVRDSRDKAAPRQLAKAYRLHARAKVPSPAQLAANVRTLLRAEPTGEGPDGPIEEVVAHAVAVQQAKFGLLVSALATLTEAGCASAGRIREVLTLLGPPTLTAWLGSKRPQLLQRYCLARLAKDGALEMKDLGGGRCANLVRYRVAGSGPQAADLKAAHRVLKRVAREEAPPRHVPPPHKRACTGGPCGSSPAAQPPQRTGPAAAAGLRSAAAAGEGASAAGTTVAAGGSVPSQRLLRRIEDHHAMLRDAPVFRSS